LKVLSSGNVDAAEDVDQTILDEKMLEQ